jgi:hypothetical protein
LVLIDDDIDADDPLISGASSITLPRFPSFLERKDYAKCYVKAGVWKFLKVYLGS